MKTGLVEQNRRCTDNPKSWKQARCPWTEQWVRKLWYAYGMEYYSAIKQVKFKSPVDKKKFECFVGKQMKLKTYC